MTVWQQQVQKVMNPKWRSWIFGDARGELLNACTDTLLVLDGSLLHLQSNSQAEISQTEASSPELLASKARELIDSYKLDANSRSILLLLPPSDFVATSSAMPGLTGEHLESALKLQQENLLPAYDQALSLSVENNAAVAQETVTALWLPEARLNELFEAFENENLMLAAVRPRVLQLRNRSSANTFIENDSEQLTAVALQDGNIVNWLAIHEQDLAQDDFSEQWQAEIANLPPAIELNTGDAEEYLALVEQDANRAYSFFPAGALSARKKVEKGRQVLMAAAALVGVMLLGSLPFIAQSFELRLANSRLDSTREMSADARSDQAVVVDFENQWGIFNDFPDQEVREALFQLQEVLGAERLSSLELTDGLIRIQGTSSDPQAILQRLEQDPMFTEVVFSRATNNTRYYIDLRLAEVNLEAYMVRYFPDQS